MSKPLPSLGGKKTGLPPLSKLSTSKPAAASPKPAVASPKPALPPISSSKTLPPLSKLGPLSVAASSFTPTLDLASKCQDPPPNLEKDPRKHLDTFFGVRNGIQGNPVEGVNYTKETLTYMLSKARADQIVQIIIDNMKALNKPIPFPVYECCTGIGGSTMGFLENAFLENPSISSVTTYECDPARREMFKRNVAMYGFDQGEILKVPETPFLGVPKSVMNAVFVADPPWLPPHIKGDVSTKDDYILSGMKLGDKTLEEWIADCVHCSLIVIRVPPGYKLNPVPGFIHDKVLVKNSMLIISYPSNELRASLLQSESARKEQFRQEKDLIWAENLRKYLRNDLLPRAISQPAILDKLTDPESMEIWKVAFTSESYAPTHGENWEEMELLGDKLLGFLYTKFMTASYPWLNRSQLSELITHYLAKGFQSDLSASIGIGPHIRSRLRTTTHNLEDVLEAVFGALLLTGDRIKDGVGPGLAYNLLVSLYENIDVDWKITLGNPKTRVKEIFETMNWVNPKLQEKVPESSSEDGNGNTIFRVMFNQLALEQLREFGVPIISPVIAEAVQSSKKKASKEAYILAVQNLEKMGITEEWVQEVRRIRDLQNPDLAPYIAAIADRLKSEGYLDFKLIDYHIQKKRGGKTTGKYIQLIGIDKDGNKKVLAMTEDPVESPILGKQMVLQDYATYNQ